MGNENKHLTTSNPASHLTEVIHGQNLGANAGANFLTHAQNDNEAVAGWLALHSANKHTKDLYEKEAIRLGLWCSDRNIKLREFLIEDALLYKAFIRNPQPAERWCLQPAPRTRPDGSANPDWKDLKREPRKLRDGSSNPRWRPFISALSESAARHTESIMFGLWAYLTATGYLYANPWQLARTPRVTTTQEIDRYFDKETFELLVAGIESLPAETERQQQHQARAKFALYFLYLTGLRRAELAEARTTHLRRKRSKVWLTVDGKGRAGGKVADIPLPADAIAALRSYRASLGLSEWPLPGDDAPLLFDIYGNAGLTPSGVHRLVKDTLANIADTAEANGDLHVAATLRRASSHWFRHSSASHQLDAGISLNAVRENMRHGNIKTTSIYLHSGKDERHEETERLRINPKSSG